MSLETDIDHEGAAWLSLLTIRPDFSASPKSAAIVSDPVNGRRARVAPTALAEVIAETSADGKAGAPPSGAAITVAKDFRAKGWLGQGRSLPGALLHWHERGWHPSLEYYLWSRRVTYLDRGPQRTDLRDASIEAYLRQDGAPPVPLAPRLVATSLPRPAMGGLGRAATTVMLQRHTVRAFQEKAVHLETLSSILWYGLGPVRVRRDQPTTPAAYLRSFGIAFDLYLACYDVEGMAAGVYWLNIRDHSVARVKKGSCRLDMMEILCGTSAPLRAALTMVLVVDFERYQWRYRHERALRHLYLAAGRVMQRLILCCEANDLSCLPTPALQDEPLTELLELDQSRQAPLYTVTVGHKYRQRRVQ